MYINLRYDFTFSPSSRPSPAQALFLRYECRGDARAKELLFLVVHNGRKYIQVVMAVLLYGALMYCRARSSATERIDEVARWRGVGVGASTGCACITFAGPNPNIYAFSD